MLCLGAFWGLPGLDSCRLIPLKARVFVERGVVWIRELCVIRGLLIVCCARHGWTQLHALLRVGIDEEEVCVSVCFLLAATGPFVWRALLAAGGVRSRQSSGRDRQGVLAPLSPHDARRARGPPRGCVRSCFKTLTEVSIRT